MLNGRILKNFIMPKAEPYQFPQADELREDFQSELFVDGPPEEPDQIDPECSAPDLDRQEETPEAKASENEISFAKIQAEAILKAARAEAEKMKSSAAERAESELERIREEAQQAGYHAGYARGMESAEQTLNEQRETLAAQMEEQIQTFLENVALAQDELMDSAKDDMRNLAMVVAEKVVRVSLKSSGGIIARMIQDATEKMKRREWVHIYIAGCDAKGLAKITPRLTRSLSALSNHIKIIPMAEEESGTCIIETPDTIVDASAATQLSNIRTLAADISPDDVPQEIEHSFMNRMDRIDRIDR